MRPASVVLAAMLVTVVGAAPALGYERPEQVSCSYDESELKAYQPDTYVGHLDVEPSASYGGIYSSPERETDVYVYFLRYPRQDGLTSMDTHVDDREPVYVLVDDRTGDVERVIYSAYHYLKATKTPSSLSMNGSHAQLYVVNPWHQYAPSSASGSLVRLKNYCEAVDDWHANGWKASVEATTNPWTMTHRDSWWGDESIEHAVWERYGEARRTLDDLVPDVDSDIVLDADPDLVPNGGPDLVPEADSEILPNTDSDLVPDVNTSVPGVGS